MTKTTSYFALSHVFKTPKEQRMHYMHDHNRHMYLKGCCDHENQIRHRQTSVSRQIGIRQVLKTYILLCVVDKDYGYQKGSGFRINHCLTNQVSRIAESQQNMNTFRYEMQHLLRLRH